MSIYIHLGFHIISGGEVGVLIQVLAPMTFSGKDGNMKGSTMSCYKSTLHDMTLGNYA